MNRWPIALAVALLSISPVAHADQNPCLGLECILAVPGAMLKTGMGKLGPTPALVQALQAIEARDDARLRALLRSHPELSRPPTPVPVPRGGYGIEETYALTRASMALFMQSSLIRGDNAELEKDMRQAPEHAEEIDAGYALLARAVKLGSLASVTTMLDAGVPATAHNSGALLFAQDEDVVRLLMLRGARPTPVTLPVLRERRLPTE